MQPRGILENEHEEAAWANSSTPPRKTPKKHSSIEPAENDDAASAVRSALSSYATNITANTRAGLKWCCEAERCCRAARASGRLWRSRRWSCLPETTSTLGTTCEHDKQHTHQQQQRPTIVQVKPVEVILAVELVPVDLAADRAGDPLQHRNGVEEPLPVSVREVPDLPAHVPHRDVEAVRDGFGGESERRKEGRRRRRLSPGALRTVLVPRGRGGGGVGHGGGALLEGKRARKEEKKNAESARQREGSSCVL